MDESRYEQWQGLHRRAALGETLTAAEQATYEAGCRDLDSEERLEGDLVRLRELRASIAEAEKVQEGLRDRETDLDARIAALEARLDERTRHLLGITH